MGGGGTSAPASPPSASSSAGASGWGRGMATGGNGVGSAPSIGVGAAWPRSPPAGGRW